MGTMQGGTVGEGGGGGGVTGVGHHRPGYPFNIMMKSRII